jgi:hypothetical protein
VKTPVFLASSLFILSLASCGDGKHASVTTDSDPNGTWKWTIKMGNRTNDVSLKLAWDGRNLSGGMAGRSNQATPITNAAYKNGTVSFSVVRENGGKTVETKYSAALGKDILVGKSEHSGEGQVQRREWKAERVKDTRK